MKNYKKPNKITLPPPKNGPPEMDWDYFKPLEVKITNNFERGFKIFRSLVQADKILSTYKEKQSYEKPSVKRRRKKNEAIRRIFEEDIKQKKILSGEWEKERVKKDAAKAKRRKERNDRRAENE
jgi:ribosomal protein S21